MSDPTPALTRRMAVAAELRAAGASWETISLRVRCRVPVCQRWPEQYPAAWSQLFATAQRQLRDNVTGEAITVLRQLLRSETEPIRRDAAKLLLAALPAAPAAPAHDFQALLDELLLAAQAVDDCAPA